MIQTFTTKNTLHILVDYPCSDDTPALEFEFSKEYEMYRIEFTRIYTLHAEIIHLLYKKVYKEKQKIKIITHTRRLNRYLSQRGFKPYFVSLFKSHLVRSNAIDIVLLGGSADSSPKVLEIIKNVHLQNIVFVLVQHVQKEKKGTFDEILQQHTKYTVKYAQDNEELQKGVVYIAPQGKHLKVKNACFELSNEEAYNFSKPSISLSYESFSNYYKERLLVIQECGFLNDGVDKLREVKENNSSLVIQNPSECSAPDMVNHALDLQLHDYILKQEELIHYINFINKQGSEESWVEFLLYTIHEKYAYDLRMYHRDTIKRRLNTFMAKHGIKNIKDAVGMIIFNPIAFKSYFLEVSINVTEFFRKPLSFENTVSLLEKNYKHAHHLKIWSAGCSSGEEVYSVAMVLESLGYLERCIIYATDFNTVILDEARNAIYSLDGLSQAQNNLESLSFKVDLKKYISQNDAYFVVNEKIKKKVLFFEHNLATDASFNEFDIIICKNVIIYFDTLLQEKVFELFYNSLSMGGFLVLGESEGLSNEFINKFQKCSEDCKIFKKVA